MMAIPTTPMAPEVKACIPVDTGTKPKSPRPSKAPPTGDPRLRAGLLPGFHKLARLTQLSHYVAGYSLSIPQLNWRTFNAQYELNRRTLAHPSRQTRA